MLKLLDLAFEIFVLWLFYKLIFDFIIPVYRSAKQVKGKMQEVQNRMKNFQQQNNQSTSQAKTTSASQPSSPTADKPGKEGEYIDFEEVKG